MTTKYHRIFKGNIKYETEVTITPDSQFIISGDEDGSKDLNKGPEELVDWGGIVAGVASVCSQQYVKPEAVLASVADPLKTKAVDKGIV